MSFYRITIGNKSDERVKKQIDEVRIFHHEPGKFVFFKDIDEMPDNRKIDQLKLRHNNEMIFTLYKNHFKTLNRKDRKCMKEQNYNWRNCQDKMFNLRKGECLVFLLNENFEKSISGCQDPWNVNPNVPLEACTNITHIR